MLTRYSIHKPTLLENKATPREDLFRRFPPEVRNRIYDLLAPPTQEDHTSPITVRFRKWRPGSTTQQKPLRWREPGLLLAAKWIRLESNYYLTRPIEIAVSTADVGAACRWLRMIVADNDAEKNLGRVTFWVLSENWDIVHSWLPLAQLCREFAFTGDGSYQPPRFNGVPQPTHTVPLVQPGYERYRRVTSTMNEVIGLGTSAKHYGQSDESLKRSYLYWLEATPLKPMKWRLALRQYQRG